MVDGLPHETRALLLAAMERKALFKTVEGEVLCHARDVNGDWSVWPLLGGEEVTLKADYSSCTCGQQKCKHRIAVQHGGDPSTKPWNYPRKKRKLGKWYIHKHA